MILRYALLADHANATQDGKLNVMGIFDRLFATSFPAVHRELYLVTCLETEAADEGETHEVHVQLINSDGQALTDLRGQLSLGQGKQIINQLHVFQDLRFENAGGYQFNIFLDGQLAKSVELELQFLPQQG
ncbi:MAG TPA: hypothetical protein VEX38_10590 [Fimbriimonadaceae bacterium]|nr:hypothetical protein [Fimbriimonadaceae bacterium]